METNIFVTVHAQTFDFIDNLGPVLVSFLRACFRHLSSHVCKEVLR
jgi:hypothetical protein